MREWLSRAFFGPSDPGPTLVTRRLELRAPTVQDGTEWRAIMGRDANVLRPWQPTWPDGHLTEDSYARRLRVYAAERRRGSGYAFHLIETETQGLVGAARLAPIHRGAAQLATVGYWVAAPRQGEGFATEALDAMVRFALGRLNLARLEAHCMPSNAASRRVLTKAGFVEEGRLTSYLEINGVRQDHLLYARLA